METIKRRTKHTKIYKLEFFASHCCSDEEWEKLLAERLFKLEQEFNASGEVRVHIHIHEELLN